MRHSEFLSWDADDRDKAIWQYLRSRQACPNCGTRAEEWDERQGGHRHAYTAEPHRCRGCELIEARKASMDGSEGRGVYIGLTPRGANAGT